MLKEALYHRPKGNYSYAYDTETLHIRIRTKKNDCSGVTLLWGDKYNWCKTAHETAMVKVASDDLFDYYQAEVQPPTRRTRYAFGLISQKGTIDLWMNERGFVKKKPETADNLYEFPFLNPIDVFEVPQWAKESVVYQIFPERFANGDRATDPASTEKWGSKPKPHNFFGGDLQGVIDHLDYLTSLGIDAIYFTPIFIAPSNHKYDTIDYKKVDPHFGDIEVFKHLVTECHSRGIRVILDAVFNHSGFHFPPFQDVIQNGANSKYADWFHVHSFPVDPNSEPPNYDCFAFYGGMPKFNTENPEVKQYLLDVAKYWIEEADIDGWRLDVANEVDHAFWREFRKVVKGAKPDAFIIGEIWHDSGPWLYGDQFDSVMNYLFTDVLLDFFARGKIRDAARFDQHLGKIRAMYPQQVTEVMFNVLDSHDTARLLTLCKNDKDKMKLASLVQLTYPGTPCIYYGDEIGLTGKTDPDCRKTMEWDKEKQDRDLLNHYQKILQLRKQYPALRRGTFETLYAEKGQKGYAFKRQFEQEQVIIALNNGQTPVTMEIAKGIEFNETAWMDQIHGTAYTSRKGSLQLSIEPFSFVILTQKR